MEIYSNPLRGFVACGDGSSIKGCTTKYGYGTFVVFWLF
jgi:hypothetical protein